MNWWRELTSLQQLFATFAIPATLVMVIQFILLLLGFAHGESADGLDGIDTDLETDLDLDMDVELDMELDMDMELETDLNDGIETAIHEAGELQHSAGHGHESVDALRLFTLRSIIAFLAVGGWMGVVAIGWGLSIPLVFVLAIGAGWLALYFVAWSFRVFLRLQQSGNIDLRNAIGNTGEVYIPIPPDKKGVGKVSVIVQERLREYNAMTEAERILKTGEEITVMDVISEGTLLVVPKNNPPEGIIIEKI